MAGQPEGSLVIIGGAEDKSGRCDILRKVVELAGGDRAGLVILTTATEHPNGVGEQYTRIFESLGAREVQVLDIRSRRAAWDSGSAERLARADGVFFTGGDQLRITSLLGGTPLDQALKQAFNRGAVIAGTSAGASAMSDTMIVEGAGEESPKQNTVKMAPGLGLLPGVVIDQHFAQRGRLGRLLAAVAQNPAILGIGLDEDTAIVVGKGSELMVIGSQTVTIIDGEKISFTNVSEVLPSQGLALLDVKIHVLPTGYRYSFSNRRPLWEEN